MKHIDLPVPKSNKSARQCRELGIRVGDTIQGRETYTGGGWSEARLTLLWMGQDQAVFATSRRSSKEPAWRYECERASWTLDCRPWRIISRAKSKPKILADRSDLEDILGFLVLNESEVSSAEPRISTLRKLLNLH